MLNRIFVRLWAVGPRWTYTRIWLHALIAAIVLTGLTWIACSALGISIADIFAENATHELLQSGALGAAVIAGVAAAALSSGLSRYAAVVIGLISCIGFLREVPSCRGDVMVFCAGSDLRGSFMAAGVILLLVATIVFEVRRRGTISQAIHPRFSWPIALVVALVGASQMSEDLHLVFLFEETLELYSYLVLLLGAGWLALRPRSFSAMGDDVEATEMTG